jgi:hypothetical protein
VSSLRRRVPDWPLIRRLRRPLLREQRWIRGRYSLGPEVSSFEPHGGSERWWTSFSDDIAPQAADLMEAARGSGVEVELWGDLSEPGEFGHMGLYARAFHVRAIRR